jgi:hypothetical protein
LDPPDSSGMIVGSPAVQSLGQMAFGPGNVLFIGDNAAAEILAVEIADACNFSAVPRHEHKAGAPIGAISDPIVRYLRITHARPRGHTGGVLSAGS